MRSTRVLLCVVAAIIPALCHGAPLPVFWDGTNLTSKGGGDGISTQTVTVTSTELESIYTNVQAASMEPLGWADSQVGQLTQTFTDSTRTFSNTVSSGSVDMYYRGRKQTWTTSDSLQISTNLGSHYLYYGNTNVALTDSLSTWGFSNAIQTAIVYWEGTKGILFKETHGMAMDWATHRQMHISEGSRYASGYVGTFSATNFTISAGTFLDEDILHSSPAATACPTFYRSGTTVSTWTTNRALPYLTSAGGSTEILYDNAGATNVVPAGQYVAYWLCALNSDSVPYIMVMGQRVDTTLANASLNNTWSSLSQTTLPSPEIRPLYRVIFHRASGLGTIIYDQTDDYRLNALAVLATGATGLQPPPSDNTLYGYSNGTWTAVAPTLFGPGSNTTWRKEGQTNVVDVAFTGSDFTNVVRDTIIPAHWMAAAAGPTLAVGQYFPEYQVAWSDTDATFSGTVTVRHGGIFKVQCRYWNTTAVSGKTAAGTLQVVVATNNVTADFFNVSTNLAVNSPWNIPTINVVAQQEWVTSTNSFVAGNNTEVGIQWTKTDGTGGAAGNLIHHGFWLIRQ